MVDFTNEQLRELEDALANVPVKAAGLVDAFVRREYRSETAGEYALHGAVRRLYTLVRCVEQVFDLLPPELKDVPDRAVRIDATIAIQSFVFNVYGLLDNLAFIWVNERGIKKSNGQPLPNGRIGLTKDKTEVRESFSAEMRTYLDGRERWFENLENFRHSLGHRIPLYIPPFTVDPKNQAEYLDLDKRASDALGRGDLAEHERLRVARDRLTRFHPWMKQSLRDPTPPVVFHPQIIADFATVEEMCLRVLEELAR